MPIELHELRAFQTVIDENGFRRAADRLHVTQSAVSQAVASLESKLDTLLIERSRPISLTESGQRVLHYANLMLNEERQLHAELHDIRQGILSTLMLAMNATVQQLYGSALVAGYLQNSPLTRLQVSVLPSRSIISAVAAETWELGFGPFQRLMPDYLTTVPLYQDTRKLVIRRDHPQLQLLLEDPTKGVRQIPLIVSCLDDADLRPSLDKLRESFGIIWEVDNLDLRLELVRAGLGMSYLDQRLLDKTELGRDLTVPDGLEFAEIPLTFGLYHRRRKRISVGARNFIRICEQHDFS